MYISIDVLNVQVKSGTIFDNVLITDDENFAEEFGNDTWGVIKDGEKKMKDAQDEEEKKKREQEEAARKAEGGGQYLRGTLNYLNAIIANNWTKCIY